MKQYQNALDWIAAQQQPLSQLLIDWSNLNTGTSNATGINTFLNEIQKTAKGLDGVIRKQLLPPISRIDSQGRTTQFAVGPALGITKRPGAALRIFLCIHTDTVYGPDDPFQTAALLPDGNLRGPGVADAKGGLLVLLTALTALEQTPFAQNIGWEVLLNPDEEIGSVASAPLLKSAAARNQIGLLFEPSLPDGALVDRRKGAGNFSIVIHGRRAHTGRDFSAGRSAILAAADLTIALDKLNEHLPGVIVNVGSIDGGSPPNVVPDLAICRFNCRTSEPQDESRLRDAFNKFLENLNQRDGIKAEIHGQFHSPPKIPNAQGLSLLQSAITCGKDLGLNLTTRPSGGSCDGNKLAAVGLANIDTLGVRGGNIHSPDEFMIPQSLVERSQLTALLLMKLATGDIAWPPH